MEQSTLETRLLSGELDGELTTLYGAERLEDARSRCAAEYCAAHLGWAVMHCTSGDNMRSIEDIQAEVQEIVLKQLT